MKNLHLFPIVSLSIVLISFVVQGNVSSPSKRLKRDPLPLTPLNLKIKNITTTSAILVWEQFLTKDLDHFEIAKQKDSELHFTIVNDRVDKFLLHYTVDNLEARTTYMLAIRAVNGKNESRDYAFAGPFTTKDDRPLEPLNVRMTNVKMKTADLIWDLLIKDNLHHFELDKREATSSPKNWTPVDHNIEKSLEKYTVPDLIPNTRYIFRFRSVNAKGMSRGYKFTSAITEKDPDALPNSPILNAPGAQDPAVEYRPLQDPIREAPVTQAPIAQVPNAQAPDYIKLHPAPIPPISTNVTPSFSSSTTSHHCTTSDCLCSCEYDSSDCSSSSSSSSSSESESDFILFDMFSKFN